MEAPQFISFEGGEGTGKTTQSRLLHDRLWKEGMQAILVHEPGSTPLGQHLRSYLMSNQPLSRESELLLFEASRAELVNARINVSLANGCHVIADRFEASTVAYQGYGRGLDLEVVERLNRFATGGRTPDITFLLDLDPIEGLRRVGTPQLSFDLDTDQPGMMPRQDVEGQRKFEDESLAFHRRVRRGFLDQANSNPDRWTIIDASMSTEQVAELVWSHVTAALTQNAAPA